VAERLFDRSFLLFKRLLDPLMLEQLTAGSQEVIREQENCPGSRADFGASVVGESFGPVLQLRNLIVLKHDCGSRHDE
jgi:hypothetical protein